MTDETILRKAIEKSGVIDLPDEIIPADDTGHFGLYAFCYGDQMLYYSAESVIFSHSFAKAFWPDIENQGINTGTHKLMYPGNWQYHLQQMVLEPEPLKYLEKFI